MSSLPSRNELLKLHETMSLTDIAFKYSVSVATVANRIKHELGKSGRKPKAKIDKGENYCTKCGAEIAPKRYYCEKCKRARCAEKALAREGITAAVRKKILDRDNFTCFYCGQAVTVEDAEIEHKIPVSRGGGSTLSNLVTSCRSCNWTKGTRTADEFLGKTKYTGAQMDDEQLPKKRDWRTWVYGGAKRPD